MLTSILLRHGLKAAGLALFAAAGIVLLTLGEAHVPGVLIGGALLVLDGAGLVYLVGKLMDPDTSLSRKWVLTFVLVAKLSVVGGLLWLSLQHFSGLGVLIGIGAGLLGLVLGLNRGSTSKEGQAAMADAEAKIAAEMAGDNGPDSG